MEIFENLKGFVSVHAAEIGTCIAILCTYIDYRQSTDRYRTLLLALVSLGALTSMGIGIVLDRDNQRMQEIVNGFAIGGNDNFPLVEMTVENGHPEFYLLNVSKDFSLYDIDCNFQQVSSQNLIVRDMWSPQSAGRFSRVRPGERVKLETAVSENEIRVKFPELRYNFYIPCKNGYFREQVVIRLIKGALHCIVKVTKNSKILYTTPDLKRYLFAAEKVFTFQHELLGVDPSVPDPEVEKANAEKL